MHFLNATKEKKTCQKRFFINYFYIIMELIPQTKRLLKSNESRRLRKKAIKNKNASKIDQIQYIIETAKVRHLDMLRCNIKKGRHPEILTAEKIQSTINKGIESVNRKFGNIIQPINEGTAIVTIKDIYYVYSCKKRQGNGNKWIWLYKIGKKKSLKRYKYLTKKRLLAISEPPKTQP